jgi:hypothetical protein
MHEQRYSKEAFEQWVTDVVFGHAGINDASVVVFDEHFAVPKLLRSSSRCSERLPSSFAWIVTDNRDVVGQRAWYTYKNAVRVVRAWQQ